MSSSKGRIAEPRDTVQEKEEFRLIFEEHWEDYCKSVKDDRIYVRKKEELDKIIGCLKTWDSVSGRKTSL